MQFYASFVGLKRWCEDRQWKASVWYTERNGDGIGMLVPHAVEGLNMPTVAMDYIAFEWICPDKEFGTGVRAGTRASISSGKL